MIWLVVVLTASLAANALQALLLVWLKRNRDQWIEWHDELAVTLEAETAEREEANRRWARSLRRTCERADVAERAEQN